MTQFIVFFVSLLYILRTGIVGRMSGPTKLPVPTSKSQYQSRYNDEVEMAGHPIYRKRLRTDRALLSLAVVVPLYPKPDRAVFYADDCGARLASSFINKNPGFTRLDELLSQTGKGRDLVLRLKSKDWSETEEVWWELSWRLAVAAEGVVNVFGPTRFVRDEPVNSFRHKYSTGAFANTVFEKVELPELEANPRVTKILYNGQPFG